MLLLAASLAAAAPALTDDFRHGLAKWRIEAEAPAKVSARGGILDVDTPKGISLWFRRPLTGPVSISFDVEAVAKGGPNDAVSDVNAFWMAHEAGEPGTAPLAQRSGAFATYDTLQTYYVGIGGNRNTTTRFRRYVGRPGDRPLLPVNDLKAKSAMLRPNAWTHIELIAYGGHVVVRRDGQTLFSYDDPQPYTRGWFALRTTKSHLRYRNFRIDPR
ncbi:DUF6250 domain-containing protein [Hephaestia mangrovi]|uniref:DUF6250 domain-containing protein n=1 Tax=Hephaestia mangrovi TaxID=2873268 RepID=UPI001CA68399|nr:DUF6250 domain-containing protein [Hephaestia mangrovi]MBY8829659.1 DUF6250 domain-containing protein [Hephaestia mangrovi]